VRNTNFTLTNSGSAVSSVYQEPQGGMSALSPEDRLGAERRGGAGTRLVIGVDTLVAHLAGAMGRPVWICLPTPSEY
jgi:hypothetical protein